MAHFGLDALGTAEKEEMRALAIRGGPHTEAERAALLDYCMTDVDALAQLLPRMLPHLDLPRALLRGRYMAAVARMEWRGVPLDAEALASLRTHWGRIKSRLVRELDRGYRVFVPTGRRLDPATKSGGAILEASKEWNLDPDALAEAAEHVHKNDTEANSERLAAIRAARRATGLSESRIGKLLEAGQDYADVPGLDGHARELAGQYPELDIGIGYDAEGVDDDYTPRLWGALVEPDPVPLPKHHPEMIRRAAELVGEGDGHFGEVPLTFSATRWAEHLRTHSIPWPRLPSGALALDDETFREMARQYPAQIGPMRELRHTFGQLRLNELAVGPDGRNRCLLSVFSSRTGRNQPSNTRFIFGPSCWLRSLIKPEPAWALAYVDWSQQELGIAAALSSDPAMMEAYRSGDFYLTFGKMAGAVPPDATKQTHGSVRDQFKTVALGVLFGLGVEGLIRKLGVPACRRRELFQLHQRMFRRFWDWSDAIEERAILTGELRTVFGWPLSVGPDANPRSLRNFPMQANGAEMMRLAACLATEAGLRVCCPVHDAFLIEAPIGEIEAESNRMQEAMRSASELVLPGFPLKTDVKLIRSPERYLDPRGETMWATVGRIVERIRADDVCHW